MKIAIFGGSFNPIHKRHEEMAVEIIRRGYVDKVIFVPTGIGYKYKNNLLTNEIRYDMIKLVTDKYDNIEVSDFEFRDKEPYTYKTLDYFKNLYPNDSIYFVCGMDNLSYIDKWKNPEHILTNYKILVIDRKIEDDCFISSLDKYKENIIFTDIRKSDVSSTFIRDLIRKGEGSKLNEYLDSSVINYIMDNKLYMED